MRIYEFLDIKAQDFTDGFLSPAVLRMLTFCSVRVMGDGEDPGRCCTVSSDHMWESTHCSFYLFYFSFTTDIKHYYTLVSGVQHSGQTTTQFMK